MSRAVTILQARNGSRRLANKVTVPLDGRPLLEWTIRRAQRIAGSDALVVATTELPEDDSVEELARGLGAQVVRGSVDDVLSRFVLAADLEPADFYLRITGDCPLLDPGVANEVRLACGDGVAYASNVRPPSFPDGLDVECFSAEMLRRAAASELSAFQREHVTPWIAETAEAEGASAIVEAPSDFNKLRWTVDEQADLEVIAALVSAVREIADPLEATWLDYLAAQSSAPEIGLLNASIKRNEGAERSLHARDGSPLPLERSHILMARAKKSVPMCAQTFSKAPTQFSQGVAPNFLERGRGARVWDVDGNEYVDYAMGLGPVILGHADPDVDRAVIDQIEHGEAFTLPHRLEVELAELLREVVPSAEMARFAKNGSDATSGAVRLARAITGRDVILCCGYHGWQDWFIATTTRDLGIPDAVKQLTKSFNYNDIESLLTLLAEHAGNVAAVILEPIGLDEPVNNFLEDVARAARDAGAILIFDEIVTGFRYDLGGVQAAKSVVPDLTALGKAMGNGHAVSAIVGNAEHMKLCEEIFFSFTAGGDATGLAAAKATITKMRDTGTIDTIKAYGTELQGWVREQIASHGLSDVLSVTGYPQRWVIGFADVAGATGLELKSLFQQEALRRGVLFTGSFNICAAHGELEMRDTQAAFEPAFARCREAVDRGSVEGLLEGSVIEAVFRKP